VAPIEETEGMVAEEPQTLSKFKWKMSMKGMMELKKMTA
jgi:hypothetical protein